MLPGTCWILLLFVLLLKFSTSFTLRWEQTQHRLHQTPTRSNEESSLESNTSGQTAVLGVVAPLKYIGPYSVLSLQFPNLQNEKYTEGITLDFVMDTGANVNSIAEVIAQEFSLSVVLSSDTFSGAIGSLGTTKAGSLFMLGDCQLAGLPPGQNFTFMRNLSAVALPHSSPAGHGLLGLNFFQSFPAGVEFDWHGTDGDEPTIIFYFSSELFEGNKNLKPVSLHRSQHGVYSLTLNVNGTSIPAILDTGSPLTVLNDRAAQESGIEVVSHETIPRPTRGGEQYGDESLTVGGVEGERTFLYRSKSSSIPLSVGDASLGEGPLYVGNLPGLAFLDGLGDSSSPAAVLGLDSLRRSYRMILRTSDNEIWFEELPTETLT